MRAYVAASLGVGVSCAAIIRGSYVRVRSINLRPLLRLLLAIWQPSPSLMQRGCSSLDQSLYQSSYAHT